MATVATAWLLVAWIGSSSGLQYSPPFADQASCETARRFAAQAFKGWAEERVACLQVKVFVPGSKP